MYGLRILESAACLKETGERNFPLSRHRSKRVRKKLVKRFGGEFRREPVVFLLPDGTVIAHPVVYQQIRALGRGASPWV